MGGGAPHYHGDPFHPIPGKCLYSAIDYKAGLEGHPPHIGYSLDGPSIYGRHLSVHAPGYNVTLDDCGGHTHGHLPYHYHTRVASAATNSKVCGAVHWVGVNLHADLCASAYVEAAGCVCGREEGRGGSCSGPSPWMWMM